MIPITAEQYAALWEEWGVSEADGTAAPSEENGGLLQKASIQGAHVIKEEIDEIDHVVTQYVSVNNSKVKNWKNAAIDFTVLSGFKISGLKATYNLLDGAKVTITSKTDPSDREEWTVRVIPCNNPAISGLYADPDIDIFDGKYYIYPTTDGFTGWNTQKFHVFSSEDMVSWDADTMYHYPNGTFKDFRESIHVFKKGGKYHFTWSCSDTGEDTYRINYAVADTLYPEKNEDGTWGTFKAEDKGTILYKVPENDILGTGHHCFVKLPNREEYYIAYARFRTPLSEYPGDKDVKGCHREICLEPQKQTAR